MRCDRWGPGAGAKEAKIPRFGDDTLGKKESPDQKRLDVRCPSENYGMIMNDYE